MKHKLLLLIICAAALTLLSACATAPSVEWADKPSVMEQREYFFNRLVNLQPKELRANAAMQEEARWLTTTAYKGVRPLSGASMTRRWPVGSTTA